MTYRILWRSTVFIITLVLIYLAFPILIVPSSLPAIKVMFINNEFPSQYLPKPQAYKSDLAPDAQIYELQLPKAPTLNDKIELLKSLHQQGMELIKQGL